MDLEELLQRKLNMERILELDGRPAPESGIEMTMEQLRADNEFLRGMLRELQRQLEEANQTNKQNGEQIVKLYNLIDSDREEARAEKQKLLTIIDNLQSQLAVNKKMRFGNKRDSSKPKAEKGKDDDKDEFDGTPGSISPQEDEVEAPTAKTTEASKMTGHQRDKYDTFNAEDKVEHKCDMEQIPAGSVIIKKEIRKVFDLVTRMEEHDFEFVTFKTPEGKVETRFYPCFGDKTASVLQEVVPGTHATSRLVSHLGFDCEQQSTPVNREMAKMEDLNFKVCKQTVTNWIWRGGELLMNLIPAFKDIALKDGANTNCDETWCRVRTDRKYKKHYIWCLVNKAQKAVIFFYDKGSRGRDTLKNFLGDRKIKSMQTDGYNVYMYLDKQNDLINIEHICCWAHTKRYFEYAKTQGSDARAAEFVRLIDMLYMLERKYKAEGLTAEEIKERRNNAETCEIIAKLASLLHDMLNIKESLSYYLLKAVNYMSSFWKQLMAWRNDGNYSMDNNIAERGIRPLTLKRKNSLQYGSQKGAEISAIYHTIIETCKLQGISARLYLQKFFQEIAKGRTDYENLLPMTIGG